MIKVLVNHESYFPLPSLLLMAVMSHLSGWLSLTPGRFQTGGNNLHRSLHTALLHLHARSPLRRRTSGKPGSGWAWSFAPDCSVQPQTSHCAPRVRSQAVVQIGILILRRVSPKSCPQESSSSLQRDEKSTTRCQQEKKSTIVITVQGRRASPASLLSIDWSSSETLRNTSSNVVSITPKLVSARLARLCSKACKQKPGDVFSFKALPMMLWR